MKKITITDSYITLGQFLKFSSIASSGSEAKLYILQEQVLVNGNIETRRGRKLYPGDIVTVDTHSFEIA